MMMMMMMMMMVIIIFTMIGVSISVIIIDSMIRRDIVRYNNKKHGHTINSINIVVLIIQNDDDSLDAHYNAVEIDSCSNRVCSVISG